MHSARPPTASASGRPLTTTSTTGVPVATTASSSSCWRPRNPSADPVAELAGRRVVGQPGSLAERRRSRRRRHARPRRPPPAPRRSRPRSRCRARGRPRRPANAPRIASRIVRRPVSSSPGSKTSPSPMTPERIDARAHLLAASPCGRGGCSRRAGRGRCRRSARRPRRRPGPGRERQHAVVLEQHERPLGERPRGARLRVGERARTPRRSAISTYGRSNSPSRSFIRSTRSTAASSSASSTRPVREAVRERRAERHGPRQLGVDARRRAPGGPPRRGSPSAGGRSRSSRRPCSPTR